MPLYYSYLPNPSTITTQSPLSTIVFSLHHGASFYLLLVSFRLQYIYIYVPLCVGGSKGKAGIHLKYYPENRDTFEMYPGKVMHMIGE